jgi:hypothetical protein
MTNLRLTALAVLSGLGIAGCLPASVLLVVPGTSNIFNAGQGTPTGGATLPVELDFVPVAGNVLSFTGPGIASGTAVTEGTTVMNGSAAVSGCASPICLTTQPDGNNLGSQPPATNISSTGTTISGIQYTGVEMFLIGVFLGPSLPVSQVASIGDYGTGAVVTPTQGSYTPLVGQTFYIGDGMTGNETGAIQQFIVPTGATRLFLGFADAMFFNGQAAMYNDNGGSLNVNLQIVPAASTPEPGSVAMMALGLAALLIGRKKLFA